MVFDALHLHSALKAGCDRVYTFNLKDFRSLAPKELEGKIAAPYQSHKHKINPNHMEPNHLHAISPPLEPLPRGVVCHPEEGGSLRPPRELFEILKKNRVNRTNLSGFLPNIPT